MSKGTLSLLQSITFEEMIRYVSVVESRNAYYNNPYDLGSKVGALIPELELFNHSEQAKCDAKK